MPDPKYKIGEKVEIIGNTINFIKDTAVSVVSVSQPGTVSNASGFSFNFVNLAAYETRSFNVVMSVPTIPTVNIDDVLTNNATISAPANDIVLSNNAFSNSQIVINYISLKFLSLLFLKRQ